MARKSKDTEALVQDIANSFQKDYIGTFSGDNPIDLVEEWIPSTSNLLNYMGGHPELGVFPQGKVIEIYGPRSSAKSLILYDTGMNCQRMGGRFILVDSESSMHKGLGIYLGINMETLIYANTRSQEEAHDFMRKSTNNLREKGFEGPILLGWDSVAASASDRELDQDFEEGKSEMGARARENSKFMRVCAPEFSQNNITCIFINQIRKKLGVMFGKTETRPGGEAIPFHASMGIEVRKFKNLTVGKSNKRIIGHKVSVFFEKNKVRPPFAKGDMKIYTDKVKRRYGLDPWSGLTDLLISDGVLVKKDNKLVLAENTSVSFSPRKISEHWKDDILPIVCQDPYRPRADAQEEGIEEDE